MTEKELLFAITNIVTSQAKSIKEELRGEIRGTRTSLEEEIKETRTSLEEEIKETRASLEVKIAENKTAIGVLQKEIRGIHVTLENHVLPRLRTIEDCYTSTYRRYQSGIEQIDTMQQDIDTLKNVVTEHSGKLNKIA